MELIVWCAMMMGQVPIHAEGIVLAESNSYYTVRFNREIMPVRKTSCLFTKPEGSSYLPLDRRHK